MADFANLQAPVMLGALQLKNRFAAGPVNTGLESLTNITQLKEFWVRTAKGGVAIATVFHPSVSSNGRQKKSIAAGFTSEDIERHCELTDALHREDCKAVLQLNHVGQDAGIFPAWSSSSGISRITQKSFFRAPSFVIRRIIKNFESSASNAVIAGYDGVEINASGRSFIASFLSPQANTRNDSWGYNQLGRFKLLLDVVRAVRKVIGEDHAVGVRFNLMELSPKGADWSETLRLVQMLRIAGVDYLCPEFGGFEDRIPTFAHPIPAGTFLPDFEALAKASELPVFFSGCANDFAQLQAITEKYPNAVFEFKEELVADDGFITKTLEGKTEDIIPWIDPHGFSRCDDTLRTERLFCLTDPLLFGQFPLADVKAGPIKRIAVIGAGVAGIVFSVIAARRGHRVTLFEKGTELGGCLHFMKLISQNNKIEKWLNLLSNALKISEVEVVLDKRVDLRNFEEAQNFDEIIVATGREAVIPDIPGIDSSNVVTYEELLRDQTPVGNRVAVLGTGRTAIAVSRYLLENKEESSRTPESWRAAWGIGDITENQGGLSGFIPDIERALRQVYLIELNEVVTQKVLSRIQNKWDWTWLLMRGAQVIRGANIENIDNHAVRISFGKDHSDRQAIRVDHVLVCSEAVPNLEDRVGFKRGGEKVTVIGSAGLTKGFCSLSDTMMSALQAAGTI